MTMRGTTKNRNDARFLKGQSPRFLYLPKAHTIIALQFSLFAKGSYDYCAAIFDLLNHFLHLRFA